MPLPPRQHSRFCSLGLPETAGCQDSITFLLHHLRAELQIQWFILFHYGIRLQTCYWSVSKSNDFIVYVATGAEMQRNINRGNKSISSQ